MNNRGLFLYCSLILVVSWTIQGCVIQIYGGPNAPAAVPWLLLLMFTPTLITLGFILFSPPARRSVRWKPSWSLIPSMFVAVVVPILIAFSVLALVEVFGWGKSGWFQFSPSGVHISGGPWLLGTGVQGWAKFVGNVLLTGSSYAALNSLAAVGEEFGWRGMLQGELVRRLGITRGIAVLGVIWAAWHAPSILAGYNYPEHPVWGALVLFPLQLIAASYFLGWLAIRTGSFWAAAIAHGAVNSIQEGITANLHMTAPHLYEDLARVGVTIVVGFLFWMLLRRRAAPPGSVSTHIRDELRFSNRTR
jgi:membrane protease YdiL (CAAX protease family)